MTVDPLTIAYVAIIVVLLACSSFFSMSETAFTSANQIRLKKLAKDGDTRAEKAVTILSDYDSFLTTILIGNNLVNIAATSIATILFVTLVGEATGSLVSTIVMTIVVLIAGEITPKTLAKRNPEKYVLKIVGAVGVIKTILRPLSWVFGKFTAYIGRKVGGEDNSTMTEEELEVMIDEIEDDGIIEEQEGELIKSAIRFDDTPVSEVYIPRVDIVALDVESTNVEAGKLFTSTGFSRIPVYEGTIDNIIGVAYAKEFHSQLFNMEDFHLRDIVRPVKYVPETISMSAMFNEFQRSKIHMAIILDSYGGTLGLVTLEDILEELVGDIWDESDDIESEITVIDDDAWLVKGDANIYDAMAKMGMEFDPEEYEDNNVSGYVFYRLNRTPMKGDIVDCPGYYIKVEAVRGRRAIECLFSRKVEERQEDQSETD